MMSTFDTHYRLRVGRGALLSAIAALVLSGCGLETSSLAELKLNAEKTTNPSPTPTSDSNSTTGNTGGPTASVTGDMNGITVTFPYVLLNTNGNGEPTLEFLSYDPCLWAQNHSSSTFPRDFNTLIVELVSINAAPGPGVYSDVAGTNNSSSQIIDPNSSFGSISSCKGTWTALAAGTSVTITTINTTTGTASGSISASLEGGGLITGQFSTTACNVASANFAGDTAACTQLH